MAFLVGRSTLINRHAIFTVGLCACARTETRSGAKCSDVCTHPQYYRLTYYHYAYYMGGGALCPTLLYILLCSGLLSFPAKLRVSSCFNTMDVTMVTRVLVRYLHNSNVRRSSASSSRPAHTERFCLARRKISNTTDIFHM